MRIEDVKRENEKYYYCENYIWPLRKAWILPFAFILGMTGVSIWINRLFLKEYFFRQAAEQEIGSIDVGYWIEQKISEGSMNWMFVIIIAINIIIGFSVVPFARGWIKSYDSYKYGKIKLIPILLYILEILVMWSFYYLNTNMILLIFAIVVNLSPVIVSSRLLYPLESRPYEEEKFDMIRAVFDFGAKIILKRL